MTVRTLAMTIGAAALMLSACSTSKPIDESKAATSTDAAAVATTVDAVASSAAPADTPDTSAAPPVDSDVETTEPDTTEAPQVTFAPTVDARAPGVSDTSIKVGVIYLDLSSAGPLLGINQGDHMAAYQAAFDEINEAGGVHGRTLEPVFAPIVPASDDQGTVACTKLTDDESVFVVLGSYVDENGPCVVTTHETPLLGGDLAMNDETLGAAKALWYAVGGGAGQANAGLQMLIDGGKLTGKVGVVGASGYEALYEQGPKQMLEAGGVDVVDVAYLDIINGAADPNALYAAAETVALKFESEGIDQIIFNNGAGQIFPNGLARTDYRPQLLFDSLSDVTLYSGGDGSDLSVLDGAIALGAFDSGNLFGELGGATADCVASQEKRLGVELLPSIDVADGEPDYWASSRSACALVGLLVATLDAAGPELNWGTFTSAGHNLGAVDLAGGLDPYVFDKDHPNGSPRVYFYGWDAASELMQRTDTGG